MKEGVSQLVRRGVAAALLSAALLALGILPLWKALAIAVLAIAVHVLWPEGRRPPGALVMQRGAAIIGPDILGFVLFAFFLALPVWMGRGENTEGIHASALFVWPLLIAPLVILWNAAASSCLSVVVGAESLDLRRIGSHVTLPWGAMAGWRRWRRGLPRFLRGLAPFLSPAAAGAVLLARDSTGIEIELRDGRRIRLPREGFETAEAHILRALAERDIRPLNGTTTGRIHR